MAYRRRLRIIGVVACLLPFAGAALQGGKPSPGLPVTSTLEEAGSVVDGTNHRTQSDGAGPYFNGVASVVSLIQGIGDWELDVRSSPTRTVLVDFREPAPGSSTSNAPFEWQLVKARFISKCSLVQSGGYLGMAAGSTINCPLHAVFAYNGYSYRLTMNPLNDGATTFAPVTCNSADASGKCNSWMVTPVTQADSSVRSIAVLLRDTTVRGKTTTTNLGYFYMTFQIDVTNP